MVLQLDGQQAQPDRWLAVYEEHISSRVQAILTLCQQENIPWLFSFVGREGQGNYYGFEAGSAMPLYITTCFSGVFPGWRSPLLVQEHRHEGYYFCPMGEELPWRDLSKSQFVSDHEEVYDRAIAPLERGIVDICQREGCQVLSTFFLRGTNLLWSTTFLQGDREGQRGPATIQYLKMLYIG